MAVEAQAYARAGLLGNPSDGYFGRTISIIVKNFSAAVTLIESEELRIEPRPEDRNVFESIEDLVRRTELHGYYGGDRLIRAAIRKFAGWCGENGVALERKNFTATFSTTIPRQVGLAGSSAITTAALRGLMQFYGVAIPGEDQPVLTLDAEKVELGINAGLQDRVVQVMEGCVSMDFCREASQTRARGVFERIDPSLLPPLYIAYKEELGKVSGQVLNTIREGFDRGDKHVVSTLDRIAALAAEGKEAILAGDVAKLHALINENFDLRAKIMNISASNHEMIQTARKCGASAKFAGSGGSIIGAFEGEEMFKRLVEELGRIGARVIKPIIE
jgi:glucuronokinase